MLNINRVIIQLCVTDNYFHSINEELHGLYRSPNIVSAIKSTRVKWAGHVARMEEAVGGYSKF